MRVKIIDRCKVWEINDKDGYAEIRFSTSRKVKENNYDKIQVDNGVAKNGYISTGFSFVRVVGHAYNQLKDISVGDTITNMDTEINLEPYWDTNNNCVTYPKSPKYTIFSLEKYVYEAQPTNFDRAPQVADERPTSTSYTKPAAQPVAQPIMDEETAADECPF